MWSSRACFSVLSRWSVRRARTLAPRRQAMWPSACARKVLPTPTGPTMATCAWASRNRSEASSLSERAVEGDLRGRVPRLETQGGIEARPLDAQRDGEAVAPRDLIAEDEEQEVLVRHLLLTGERESLGQRVEHARELQTTEHGFQIGTDRISGHRGLLRRPRGRRAGGRIDWRGAGTARAGMTRAGAGRRRRG